MATSVHPEARHSGIVTSHYLRGIKRRLDIHGEPVKHIVDDENNDWVKAQFHEPPSDVGLSGIEVSISSNNPYLTGRADWFPNRPVKWKTKNHSLDKAGSKFVIRGFMYQVTDVKINHRGGIRIELVKDKCCSVPDPLFCEELASFTCDGEPCPEPSVVDVIEE